jgi:hypothetical protein
MGNTLFTPTTVASKHIALRPWNAFGVQALLFRRMYSADEAERPFLL